MKRYFKEAKWEFIFSNLFAVLDVICVSYYPYLLSYVIDHFHSLKARDLFFIFGFLCLEHIFYCCSRICKQDY